MAHNPSFGAVLAWDDAGGTSYTAVGQVKDIKGPNVTRGSIQVTDHDSADGFHEFLGGLVDGGEATFVIGFDNTNAEHAALYDSMAASTCTVPAWQLTLNVCSGTAVWTFNGFVRNYAPGAPVEGENTVDVTVKISGKPALTVS